MSRHPFLYTPERITARPINEVPRCCRFVVPEQRTNWAGGTKWEHESLALGATTNLREHRAPMLFTGSGLFDG